MQKFFVKFVYILYTKTLVCAIIFVEFLKKGLNMSNVNKGHRNRMRERMLNDGLSGFQDHEILELLLFQSIPRKDTNKIAHTLLDKFGSLANVLDASPQQLMMVDGISQVTACNIAVLKEVWQRYRRCQAYKISLKGIADIVRYTQLLIADSYVEKLVVVYVDHATRFLMKEEYVSESNDSVSMDLKSVVSSAVRCNAAGVMLFHCHIEGACLPSDEDYAFTERLYFALVSMNIMLLEHIIFNANGEYYSFFAENDIKDLSDKFNSTVS